MVLERRLEKIQNVVRNRQGNLVVVIEDIHDPHNAEAIFRTCDAFGVQEVYLIFEKTKPWDPSKIGKQSSSSAHKWLTFHTFRSSESCFSHLKKKGYFLVATVLDAKAPSLFQSSLGTKPLALLVGNEHRGLSAYALAHADMNLTIPMRGMIESLNVSVATALFLYEITRQRGVTPLSLDIQQRFIDDFIKRSSKGTRKLLR